MILTVKVFLEDETLFDRSRGCPSPWPAARDRIRRASSLDETGVPRGRRNPTRLRVKTGYERFALVYHYLSFFLVCREGRWNRETRSPHLRIRKTLARADFTEVKKRRLDRSGYYFQYLARDEVIETISRNYINIINWFKHWFKHLQSLS